MIGLLPYWPVQAVHVISLSGDLPETLVIRLQIRPDRSTILRHKSYAGVSAAFTQTQVPTSSVQCDASTDL